MTAAANEDGGDSEKSRFRCLDAARYVVAAAVTVLILAVIVTAIKVVLRLDSLQISVHNRSINTIPIMSPPEPEAALVLELQLRGENPSGRVRMYYLNITAYLFDNTTSASASTDPESDSVLFFKLPKDIAVLQQEAVDSSLNTNPPVKKNMMDPLYFDMLYNGSRFSDMTLRLDGNLVTEVTSEFNRTRPTTYYCEQLLVGGNPNDDASKSSEDVVCKQQRSAAPP
ncbi:hypothetical protein U9M48_030042 [Paspalum notatum var. saurae]|uniref:Uncharacterized protein n=1 Tax=Paspalum notatum var. saurae TaxID=547442 RepID=A0AAQ3X2W4_PASNO